jgi:hypothetical protein
MRDERSRTAAELEQLEPLFIKNAKAMKLLDVRPSLYWRMVRQKRFIVVGKGKASRAYFPSIKAYAEQLLAEAAKTGEAA